MLLLFFNYYYFWRSFPLRNFRKLQIKTACSPVQTLAFFYFPIAFFFIRANLKCNGKTLAVSGGMCALPFVHRHTESLMRSFVMLARQAALRWIAAIERRPGTACWPFNVIHVRGYRCTVSFTKRCSDHDVKAPPPRHSRTADFALAQMTQTSRARGLHSKIQHVGQRGGGGEEGWMEWGEEGGE